ncbi:MAG: dTDP-4-amino-4,6-dideoxygalactose transaminase [Pseudomonadota bacterium]
MERIPYNLMTPVGREAEYVAEAMNSGRIGSSARFTRTCEAFLRDRLGAPEVLLTSSCTSSLEISVRLLDLQPGEEVILPSFTFVTTASAVVRGGGRPVFVDIEPGTMNIDCRKIEAAITPKTRAVIPVHYAGVGCDLEALQPIAEKHGLVIIEDAAQAIGSTYQGSPLGTIGSLGAISFHETKNIGCGEGGALIINDPSLIERARIIRDKGTNRFEFEGGKADKYTWVGIGSSYALAEMNAAYLLGQLEALDHVTERRRSLHQRYIQHLRPLADRGCIEIFEQPGLAGSNGHIFYLLARSADEQKRLLAHCQASKVLAVFHYVPLHSSPMGRSLGWQAGDLPITEDLANRLVRLPMFESLDDRMQLKIVQTVSAFFGPEG